VTCLENTSEQIEKPLITNPPLDTFNQKPVMNRIKIAREITLDDLAAPRPGIIILQLYLHGPDSMVRAAFRPEAVREAMKVAFPNRLHGHQHRALDDAVSQGRDTQWPSLAIRFRDTDSLDRLRVVLPRQQVRSQAFQLSRQTRLHPLLVYSVNARRIGATRRQHDPGSFGKPRPIGNEPEKTIEPTVSIALCPCRELVLHFTDYQRSSPHWVR